MGSFREFIRQVNPHYQFYRHCDILIDALQLVADDKIFRLMVFWPPRHSKSETVSRLFPAYYLLRHPERFVGLTSYAADLSYGFSRVARDHYQHAGGAIRPDASAVKYWLTPAGGGLWAAGVGGPITGRGFHLGIIDDPLKNAEEAGSPTVRAKHQDWYGSTWSTRREPIAAEILVMTRWHESDLAGYVLDLEADEPEHWTIISMPAIAEPLPTLPESCTVIPDWRAPGEALCPERYDAAKLQKIERRIGPYYFGALFQQRPAPKSGGSFDRAHFIIVRVAPAAIVRRVRYWDLAGAAAGKGDWTAGVLMALMSDGRFLVEDVVRGQWQTHERNQLIRSTVVQDNAVYGHVETYIEQAPGLAKEATDTIIRLCAGYPIEANPVRGDKLTRAEPYADQAQANNVLLLAAPWNATYIDEHIAFPNGRNDDQVDGGSGALNKLTIGVFDAPLAGGSRQTYAVGVR